MHKTAQLHAHPHGAWFSTHRFSLSLTCPHTRSVLGSEAASQPPRATRPGVSLSAQLSHTLFTHAQTRTVTEAVTHAHRHAHTRAGVSPHEGCLQSLPRAQSHRRVHSRIAACACARTQPRHIEHRGHVCNDPAAGAGGLLASTRIEQHGARTLSASQCRQPASSHHTPARPRVVAHYTA